MSRNKYLTKAQKDAIIRKIDILRAKKRVELRDFVKKNLTLSECERSIIDDAMKMKELYETAKSLQEQYKDTAFRNYFRCILTKPCEADEIVGRMIEDRVNDMLGNSMVSSYDIRMDLELSEVKDFDIEKFIEKYV